MMYISLTIGNSLSSSCPALSTFSIVIYLQKYKAITQEAKRQQLLSHFTHWFGLDYRIRPLVIKIKDRKMIGLASQPDKNRKDVSLLLS